MDKLLRTAVFTSLLHLLCFTINAQEVRLCTKHLQINKASTSTWNPGIVQHNSQPSGGTLYEIEIKIRKGGYFTFQNVIIENEVLAIEVMKDGKRNATPPFTKGDVLTLIARSDKRKPQQPPGAPILKIITKEDAQGAVSYSIKNKSYLHTITAFTSATEKKILSQ